MNITASIDNSRPWFDVKLLTYEDSVTCLNTDPSLWTPDFFDSLHSQTFGECIAKGGAQYFGFFELDPPKWTQLKATYSAYDYPSSGSGEFYLREGPFLSNENPFIPYIDRWIDSMPESENYHFYLLP